MGAANRANSSEPRAFRVERIPVPPPHRLDRLLGRPGAVSLAGEWLGTAGDWFLLWPGAERRYSNRGRYDLSAVLDELDRTAEFAARDYSAKGASPSSAVSVLDGWSLALSYDAGRRFEPWPKTLPVRPEVDDLVLVRHRGGVFLPRFEKEAWLAAPADDWEFRERELRRGAITLCESSGSGVRLPLLARSARLPAGVTSDFPRDRFRGAIGKIRRGISRGDFYQVNLTRRFRIRTSARDESAPAIFRRLRSGHAAPLGFFQTLGGGRALLSNSPELFLAADFESRGVVSSPIKGTALRGDSAGRDSKNRIGLSGSEKDRAEHVMIVDLVRNDIGRVGKTGSVDVAGMMRIQSTPVVHHLVSDVTAQMRADVRPGALLRAAFPGGSVTGAPKIAALAAIERLETVRRGFYCGALGFYDRPSRRLELNLAIRTGLHHGDVLDFHAGGGIVWDSDADREWEEGNWKAEEFFELASKTSVRRR